MKRKSILRFFFILLPLFYFTQETENTDTLFTQARTEAFDNKDYNEAKALAQQALLLSPGNEEISVFLARVYYWDNEPAEAKKILAQLENRDDLGEDYYLAYGTINYWEDQSDEAERIVNNGLHRYPQSEDLLLLKARIQNAAKQYSDADRTVQQLLRQNESNAEARQLAQTIRRNSRKNQIGILYNFSHFDEQFADDWHYTSLSYTRRTPIGSVIGKVNYANRFGDDGVQYEIEAYPSLSKTFYLYLGAGFSEKAGIFPQYRTGASLYANLPKSFEGEIGYRQLHFTDDVWIYTGSVGKYYKNLWFNLRGFFTPSDGKLSQSYALTTRYYPNDNVDNYLSFVVGTGITPDEVNSYLLNNINYDLLSYKAGIDYNFTVKDNNIFGLGFMYYNSEYLPKTYGSQYSFTLSYDRRF